MYARKNLIILAVCAAAAVLLVVATQGGWSNRGYQLGGTFIGNSGDLWSAVHIPLDPAGQTASIRINSLGTSGWAALLPLFGANTVGESVGEMAMISRDTARTTTVGYVQNLKSDNTLEIKAIYVMTGTVTFTGPDGVVINITMKIYDAATGDRNKDGFPDEGAVPMLTIPGITGSAKRVHPQW
jgi:hypothetical protein